MDIVLSLKGNVGVLMDGLEIIVILVSYILDISLESKLYIIVGLGGATVRVFSGNS